MLFGNIFFSLIFIIAEIEGEETEDIKIVDKVRVIDVDSIASDKLRLPEVYNIEFMDNLELSLI